MSFQGVTLGQVVNRPGAPQDVQGKYLGLGTFANANKGLFNTKESVLVDPAFANLLNQTLQQTMNQGTTGDRNFSAGIFGARPDGSLGFFVPSIQQYYPDDRARVSVPAEGRGNQVVLPGSTAARQLNAQGIAAGLAYVKNPVNQTGQLRVGSKGYKKALVDWATGQTAGNEADMQHLLGQGAVYGLGPVFALFGIDVVPVNQGGNNPVRFRLGQGADIRSVINNAQFTRAMDAFYNSYLKNPDQVKLGRYGAASLALRHADKMTTGDTGDQGNLNASNQAIMNAWQQTGSVKGAVRWGSNNGVDYSDRDNRRGITAFPLRDAQGNAVSAAQSVTPMAGDCNIYGSGPGISQNATSQGFYGTRFYKTKRNYAKKNGKAPMAQYHCAFTPDNVINPDRKIYQPGGARGGQLGLDAVLQQYGDPNFSAQDLRNRYADWIQNPEAYGTNPAYILKGDNGYGFARYAPKVNGLNLDPNLDLNQAYQSYKSAPTIQRLGGQPQGFTQFAK